MQENKNNEGYMPFKSNNLFLFFSLLLCFSSLYSLPRVSSIRLSEEIRLQRVSGASERHTKAEGGGAAGPPRARDRAAARGYHGHAETPRQNHCAQRCQTQEEVEFEKERSRKN